MRATVDYRLEPLSGIRISGRVHSRVTLVTAASVIAALVAAIVAFSVGKLDAGPWQLLGAATANGTPQAELALELRGPRIICGLLTGAALGASGALLQSIARNPLASPDIVGVNQGASLAAVLAFTIGGAVSQGTVSLAALGGGLLAGALVYALAWRDGVRGDRLVLVGIGLAASLAALTSLVLVRADVDVVARIVVWLTGSLAYADWAQARFLALAVPLLLLLAIALGRVLASLELGDDLARALGWRVELRRMLLLGASICLAAAATSVAGPIVFVALIAPQVARLLCATPSPRIGPSLAVGSFIVVVADLVGDSLLGPRPLPVGVVTAAVGAPFMLWLLNREARALT